MLKRLFDCSAAAVGLLLLLPVLLLIAAAVKLSSPGPVLFGHRRIGRYFQPFTVYKFRTMVDGAASGGPITWGGSADPRITRIGRFLRVAKLDELPQLLNVLKGDMSLVGPRPEVAHYVDMFRDDYREILQVRPGITDFASLKFYDEASVMSAYPDPREAYATRLLPEKIRLAKMYVHQSSMAVDLALIGRTLLNIAWRPKTV